MSTYSRSSLFFTSLGDKDHVHGLPSIGASGGLPIIVVVGVAVVNVHGIWEDTEVTMAGKVGKAVITNYGANTPVHILCSLALRVSTIPTVSSIGMGLLIAYVVQGTYRCRCTYSWLCSMQCRQVCL